MQLSKEAVEEFKEIYFLEFGERISDEKARRICEGLLELFSIVYPPELLNDMSNPKHNPNSDNTLDSKL